MSKTQDGNDCQNKEVKTHVSRGGVGDYGGSGDGS